MNSRVKQEKQRRRGIYSQYKVTIIAGVISTILGGLVFARIKTPINILFDFFRDITIQKIEVRNVPMKVSGEEIIINNGKSVPYLSNYIENNLLINNAKSSNVPINKISIKNVNVDTSYKYEDVRVHFGFDYTSQNFSAYAFNNGNKKVKKKYHILVTREILGNHKSKDATKIFEKEYFPNAFKKGDIKRIINQDLTVSSILSRFTSQQEDQVIRFKIKEGKKIVVDEVILYDESNGKFHQNKGFIGAPNDKTGRVIFELKYPYKSVYTENIIKEIPTGKSVFSFNILLDKTAYLEYDVELKYSDGGGKRANIHGKQLHQQQTIRVPVYNIIDNMNGDHGEIYLFARKHNILKVSLERVKILDTELIYTTKATKKKYKLIE